MKKFKLGDVVVATGRIWRVDGKSELGYGESAVISRVWQTTPSSQQIVDLEISGKLPIHDLVCFEDLPIKLKSNRLTSKGLMKQKKPKPKSVDEAWVIEFSENGKNFKPISIDSKRGYLILPNIGRCYIRKWRAVKVCEWKYDDIDGYYQTACGDAFIFTDGTPKDNKAIFCPYCGGKIKVRK